MSSSTKLENEETSLYTPEIIGESDEPGIYNPPKEDDKYNVKFEHDLESQPYKLPETLPETLPEKMKVSFESDNESVKTEATEESFGDSEYSAPSSNESESDDDDDSVAVSHESEESSEIEKTSDVYSEEESEKSESEKKSGESSEDEEENEEGESSDENSDSEKEEDEDEGDDSSETSSQNSSKATDEKSEKSSSKSEKSSSKSEKSSSKSEKSPSKSEKSSSKHKIVTTKTIFKKDDFEEDEIYVPKNLIGKTSLHFEDVEDVPSLVKNIKITHSLLIEKGTKVSSKRTVGDFIFENSSGQFYKIKTEDKDNVYQIKFTSKKLDNEIKILEKIGNKISEFIPLFLEKSIGEFKSLKLNYIIQERFDYNLNEVVSVKKFNDEEIVTIGLRILDGLKWLHSKKILYVNMDPKNFSYNELEEIKFTNFEFAQLCTPKEDVCRGDFRENKNTSTSEYLYAAINVQKGSRVAPESDVEGLIYLLYSITNNGILPWNDSKFFYSLKEKENYIPDSQSLYKIITYLRSMTKTDILDYEVIGKQIQIMNKKRIPKVPEIFEQKPNEDDARFEFRIKLYNMIGAIDFDEDIFVEDKAIMKITELLLNKYWYGVTYDTRTEKMISVIQEKLEETFEDF